MTDLPAAEVHRRWQTQIVECARLRNENATLRAQLETAIQAGANAYNAKVLEIERLRKALVKALECVEQCYLEWKAPATEELLHEIDAALTPAQQGGKNGG